MFFIGSIFAANAIMIQVVWFKRDLRTVDHRPLAGAAKAGPVLPLYVAEPDYWASPTSSMRQWKAIAPTLEELSNRLTKLGGPLIIRIGSVVEILSAIHERHGISRLLAHEETGDWHTFERDKAVRRFCRATGIEFVEYPQFGVKRAMKDRNQWAKLHAAYMKEPLIREPSKFSPVPNEMAGRTPEGSDLGLTPDGCEEPQLGTRHEALGRLHSFFAGRGMNYRKGMSSPLSGETVCSRLSSAVIDWIDLDPRIDKALQFRADRSWTAASAGAPDSDHGDRQPALAAALALPFYPEARERAGNAVSITASGP